ncbi:MULTISPECIES: hypothetical protein [Providencia]|uniref:Type VI secretion protein n=3 Tax=Providencia rettgeri TaxID=587 RepID=A0AB35LB67_PRORE|nr:MULTISPECIES: hypothetical protein [Providencia]EJD6475017.1 hypothetical protein [Providencia rettgeri]ELR5066653.1 hypothetical protein [Providencia rettgeri]ELR5163624.1 hypothetical protein [Providencia rettgeri]ELR5287855.1 hypothetical protein [Providencia rettgeri]EMC8778500.1 hypothetical protein [Providencia rettgeri]
MIQPDATLPPLMSIPNKFNLFHTIIISLSIGLIVCITLFCFSTFESNHRLVYIFFISFITSSITFLSIYLTYIQRINYINQWNLERDRLIKEKTKLKRRTINSNLIFTMTALGNQGNSLFALTDKNLLKQTEKEDKSIIKNANIPILTSKNSTERFTGILDHFLLSNTESISKIASNKQTRFVILDNINELSKEYLIEKINKISSKNISNQIQFLPPNKLSTFMNEQANLLAHPPIFLLGMQINTETSYYSEAVVLLELLSNSENHGANIHQSPENILDYCIENVLSFGGNIPYAIENIWHSNIDEFELSQILEKLSTLGISPQPKLINANAVFGETSELSELLLISLALEQTQKSDLPQLILNTENMHKARIISNKNH